MTDDAPVTSGIGNPRRWIASLVLFAFVAGAGAGALATYAIEVYATSKPAHGGRGGEGHNGPGKPKGGPGGREGPQARMFRELALDEATQAKVQAIFESRRGKFEDVLNKIKPEMDKARAETRAEVRASLPAEKQAAFDKLMAEEDAHPRGGPGRRGEHGDRGDGPHHGPDDGAPPPPPPAPR